MILLTLLLALAAGAWGYLALSSIHRRTYSFTLEPGDAVPEGGPRPKVSILVPARNEEDALERTVPALARQRYDDFEVIIIDDHSTDRTPEILAGLAKQYPVVRVVEAPPAPAGWVGKNWAVLQGIQHARGDLLLFTDADIAFHPLAVSTAVGQLQRRGADMLSVFPSLELTFAFEALAMESMVSILMSIFPLAMVNDPKSSVAFAAGGFILIRRSVYEEIGGHEAVRTRVAEDVNLAKETKSHGRILWTGITQRLLSTRMYANPADVWEGVTKNLYAGMDYDPRKLVVGVSVWLLLGPLMPLYWLWAYMACLPTHSLGDGLRVMLAVGSLAAMLVVHARVVTHLRLPAWHVILPPVTLGFYSVCALASAWNYAHGGNAWKGRRYD